MTSFLTIPTDEEIQSLQHTAATHQTRPSPEFTDLSGKFRIREKRYTQQYAQMYFCRLRQLEEALRETAKDRWPTIPLCDYLKDISMGVDCVAFGTVCKDMKLRPSVLNQYLDTLAIQTNVKSFLSPTDFLLLEDTTARICLRHPPSDCGSKATDEDPPPRGSPVPDMLVTGVVLAVRGRKDESGYFVASDWTLAGVPSVPLISQPSEIHPVYVAFASGLHIGAASMNSRRLLLLREFLMGSTGGSMAASIARFIVVGNSLAATTKIHPQKEVLSKDFSRATSTDSFTMLKEADTFFAELASSIPIDVMPGPEDPCNYSLPQQALHPALFSHARYYSTFTSTTNPYAFSLDGVRFIGTSGQPVEDVKMFSSVENSLDALKLTVESRCLCPTAPDTLLCYPFTENDPFCLSSTSEFPHVVFSGNHDYMAWEVVKPTRGGMEGTLCLCLPCFDKQPSIALVDVRTLDVMEVSFDDETISALNAERK